MNYIEQDNRVCLFYIVERLTDIIERSTDDLKYLSDDPSGSVKHTHDTLKTCLGNCNSVVIPKISKKKS